METLVIGVELDLPQEEIDKLAGSTTGIADEMASSLDGANSALSDFSKQTTAGSRAVTGLASAVSLVDPRLGQVIRSVGTLARGLSVLRLGLGPAAIAVGALTTAAALYREEQDRVDRQREASVSIAESHTRLEQGLSDVYEELSVAAGELSAKELEILNVRRAAFTQNLDATKGYITQISEQSRAVVLLKERIQQQEERQRGAAEAAALMGRATQGQADAINTAQKRADAHSQTLRNLRAELGTAESVLRSSQVEFQGYRENINELVGAKIDLIEKTEQEREAEEAARAAKRAAAAADREAAKAANERRRVLDDLKDAREELANIEQSASDAVSSQVDLILNRERDRIVQINEVVEAHYADADALAAKATTQAQLNEAIEAEALAQQVASDAALARIAVETEAHEAMADLRAESIEKLRKMEAAANDERLANIEKERALRLEVMGHAASALGSLSDLAMDAARRKADTDEAAAQRALEMSKKLAQAEATVTLASGVLNASARYAGRPIATGIAVAAMLATYAAQTAAIQSATLHGGGYGLAPDEVRASDGSTRLREERVVSPRGSRDEESLRRIERGEGGTAPVMVPVYRHFGRFERDLMRGSGAIATAVRQSGQRVGPGRY